MLYNQIIHGVKYLSSVQCNILQLVLYLPSEAREVLGFKNPHIEPLFSTSILTLQWCQHQQGCIGAMYNLCGQLWTQCGPSHCLRMCQNVKPCYFTVRSFWSQHWHRLFFWNPAPQQQPEPWVWGQLLTKIFPGSWIENELLFEFNHAKVGRKLVQMVSCFQPKSPRLAQKGYFEDCFLRTASRGSKHPRTNCMKQLATIPLRNSVWQD